MDVQAQLSQLSPEARAALARKIKAQLSEAPRARRRITMSRSSAGEWQP